MSTIMDENFKRWTAKRTSALVIEIIQGKTTVRRIFQIKGWQIRTRAVGMRP